MSQRRKKIGPCTSPNPRPEYRTCPIPDCGVYIPDNHWCCREHWERFPLAMRFHGNQFRDHWAGDPVYDDFIAKALLVNAELEAQIAAQEAANPDWTATPAAK